MADIVAKSKTIRLVYVAGKFTTGLTDLVLVVRKPDTSIYSQSLSATEIGGGLYFYDFPVPASPLGVWEATIDSASVPAKAAKEFVVQSQDLQDVYDQIVIFEGASFAASTDSLHAIRAAIDALASQVSSIQTSVLEIVSLPEQMLVPATSFTDYEFHLDVYTEAGALVDADANPTVAVRNVAGTDRGGNVVNDSGANVLTMVRDSLGRYHLRYRTQSTAVEEELIWTFSYARSSISRSRISVNKVVNTITEPFQVATAQTLLDIEGTGFVSATMSLAALQALLVAIEGAGFVSTDSLHSMRAELTLMEGAGFATATDSLRVIRGNLDTYITDVKGSGFVTGTDSLRQISQNVLGLRGGLIL